MVGLGRSYLRVFLEHVSQNCCGWTSRKMGGAGPENDITPPRPVLSLILGGITCPGQVMSFFMGVLGLFGKLDPLMSFARPCSRVLLQSPLPPTSRARPAHFPVRIQSRTPMPRHVAYLPRRPRLHLPPVSPACTPLHPPLPVVSLYCLITCDDACPTIRIWDVPHTRLTVCYSHRVRLNTQN